jgi:hypothetical protein
MRAQPKFWPPPLRAGIQLISSQWFWPTSAM